MSNQRTPRDIHPSGRRRVALLAVLVGLFGALALFGTAFAEGGNPPSAPLCGDEGYCLSAHKESTGFNGTTGVISWTVTFSNPNATARNVTVLDCFNVGSPYEGCPLVTLVSVSGASGSCSGDLSDGLNCTIPGNATLTINTETKVGAGAGPGGVRCVDEEVYNQASASTGLGTYRASAQYKISGTPNDPACTVQAAPAIHLTKTPSTSTLPAGGGNVTYTYTVTNTGNVPLSNVTVSDDHCTPATYQSGDANNDSKLDLSETWTYTCTQNLTASTTNVATATGHDGETTVTSQASATVTVGQTQTVTQTITVMKILSPSDDPGTFDLTVDGTTVASVIGNGGSGSKQVDPGQHSIGEIAHSPTSLANYTVTYSANCADGVVTVTAGQNITCTITNTRVTASPPPPVTTLQTFNPPVVLTTQTPTPAPPTVTPTPAKQPTEAPRTPTEVNTVAGEKTPGAASTPRAPEAGGGTTFNWFHSNQALIVIAFFLLSALLSGAVVLTTGKKE